VDVEGSRYRVKANKVTISLKKIATGENWWALANTLV